MHALNGRLRRLELRIRPHDSAEDRQARQERALERIDALLVAYPAPPWCQEQQWSRAERLAARVVTDPGLTAVCERRAAEQVTGPFFRRLLAIGARLAAATR